MARENFSKTHGLLYALLLVFVITFIVFPAVSFDTNMKCLGSLANSQSWFVLLINTVFSIFDTIGRKMGGVKAFDLSSGAVKIVTVSRLIFIATFYLIAFQTWKFNADWFIVFNMAIFAWSNGYAGTLCACKAPGTVPAEERGQVGGFIGTTITLGILIGSTIAVGEAPILKMTPGMASN
jgi:hypothetical protein